MPTISSDVNRPAVPWDGAAVTAEVDVEPGRGTVSGARHIALVIDTSGSMGGEKIAKARDGASWVFGLLEGDDYVTIVSFDSAAEFVMRPTKWADTSREAAMSAIDRLTAGGGTDMFDGLETAGEALRSIGLTDEDAVRRILLLSDGKDNTHRPEDFESLAANLDGLGIRIRSAGIGEDYNQETIRTLGTTARGEWTHLDAAGDIEAFFGDAVEAANDVVATDAQLEIDVAPGVEITDVHRALPQAQRVDPTWEDNVAIVKLPDLTEREHQRVTMKVHAPAMEGTGSEHHILADLTLSAKGTQTTGAVTVEYTDENERLAQNREQVDLDHRQTVVSTELGRGNVETAETHVEKMTQIHGADTKVVQEVERQTELVKEGGRAERNRATKIVANDESDRT